MLVLAPATPTHQQEPILGRVSADGPLPTLVEQAKAGDRRAYSVLYQRLRGVVHGVILARVSHRDAQDLVQDTFMAGWTRLGDLRDPAAFPGWIVEIARRRAIDHGRRRARDEAKTEELADHGLEPAPRSEAEEALRAIQLLPEAYREPLVLRLVEGLSGPEIAEMTGLTPESVRVNLCRGMKLLKEKLGKMP